MTTPKCRDEEEYASQSMLLQEFSEVPNIEQAWTFKSTTGMLFGLVLHTVVPSLFSFPTGLLS